MYTRGWIDHAGVRKLLDPLVRSASSDKLKFVQAGQVMSRQARRRAFTPAGATLTTAGATGLFAIALAILVKLNEMSSAEPLAPPQSKTPSDDSLPTGDTTAGVTEVALSDNRFSSLGNHVGGLDSLSPLGDEQPVLSEMSTGEMVSFAGLNDLSEQQLATPERLNDENPDAEPLQPGDVFELDNASENILAVQFAGSKDAGTLPSADDGTSPPASDPQGRPPIPVPDPEEEDDETPGDSGDTPLTLDDIVQNADALFAQLVTVVDQMVADGIDFANLSTEEFQFFTDMFLVFASGWEPGDPAPDNAADLIGEFVSLYGEAAFMGSDTPDDGGGGLILTDPGTDNGGFISVDPYSPDNNTLTGSELFKTTQSPSPTPEQTTFGYVPMPTLLPLDEPPASD